MSHEDVRTTARLGVLKAERHYVLQHVPRGELKRRRLRSASQVNAEIQEPKLLSYGGMCLGLVPISVRISSSQTYFELSSLFSCHKDSRSEGASGANGILWQEQYEAEVNR